MNNTQINNRFRVKTVRLHAGWAKRQPVEPYNQRGDKKKRLWHEAQSEYHSIHQ